MMRRDTRAKRTFDAAFGAFQGWAFEVSQQMYIAMAQATTDDLLNAVTQS
jgi:hypothetical protein